MSLTCLNNRTRRVGAVTPKDKEVRVTAEASVATDALQLPTFSIIIEDQVCAPLQLAAALARALYWQSCKFAYTC